MERRIWVIDSLFLAFAMVGLCSGQTGSVIRLTRHSPTMQPAVTGNKINVSSGDWSQLAQLSATGFSSGLGVPVAISGDTIVIARPLVTGQTVLADVYVKGPNGWRAGAPIAALSATVSQEPYLASVSMDGDTIVVTGPVGFEGIAGYAFVYVKPPGGWQNMTPTAILSPSDSAVTNFGYSVSISGDTIVVGDPGNNDGTADGAAYVYVKPAGGWQNMTETALLTASDANISDNFGYSVSISNGTIAVGATQLGLLGMGGPGKAYVFVEPLEGWKNMTQTAELTVSGASGVDEIGFSVGTDGTTVIVGAPSYNDFFGAVFVYAESGTGWSDMTETATLAVGDGLAGGLGNSVAMSGKIVIAGASFRGFPPNGDEGGVYVFEEPASGWQNASSNVVLTGSDAHYGAAFGLSVGISGKTLVGSSELFRTPSSAFVFGLP